MWHLFLLTSRVNVTGTRYLAFIRSFRDNLSLLRAIEGTDCRFYFRDNSHPGGLGNLPHVRYGRLVTSVRSSFFESTIVKIISDLRAAIRAPERKESRD